MELVEAVGAGDAPGEITGITCPECHGSLWVQSDNGAVTFRCRIGHEFAPDALFDIQADNVEAALWAGVRALEEQASLARFMAQGARRRDDPDAAERHEARRGRAEAEAAALRRLLTERD